MLSNSGMGIFRVDVEVGDPTGTRYEPVDALVDTGATHTSLPRPMLETLGVTPHARKTFVLADGRRVKRDIGRACPLLGAYALEGLQLAADPVGRRLVPVPGLLLASV